MKKILVLVLVFSLTRVYAQTPVVSIIPQPVDIQQSAGSYIHEVWTSIQYAGHLQSSLLGSLWMQR